MTGKRRIIALIFALVLLGVIGFLSRSGSLQVGGRAGPRPLGGRLILGGLAEFVPQYREGSNSSLPVVTGDSITSAPSLPVSIEMRSIPAGDSHGISKYERWQRGEVDLSKRHWVRDAGEVEALRQEASALPADEGIFILREGLRANAPAPGTGFASIDITGCCGSGATVPPDPELAVGPNHMIVAVNIGFQIYNKQGTSLIGPLTFPSLFSALPGCDDATSVFDPNVLYDEAANRFFLAIDQRSGSTQSNYCVAVSKSGDPTGQWWLYRFPMNNSGASNWMDYPHAGIGRDAIYMGGNLFNGSTYLEGRIWAFPKNAMYAGQAATAVERGLGFDHDTPQPINLHGYLQGSWPTSGPHHILVETNFNGKDHTLFAWTDPFGTNSLSVVAAVDLNTATSVTAGFPVDVPQSGGNPLQANDWRPLDFEYRNGYGWTTMTVSCNPGGGTVDCVRWARINLANGAITQAGVFASNGEYRFFPDLAVNHCNDMAIGYTKSSSSTFPGAWVTGRLNGDPAGTVQSEVLLKAGEITYTAFDPSPRRWGDYTGMTIDPDGVTFWYLGQYSKNTGSASGRWGTYVGSYSFASCSTVSATPTATQAPTPTKTPVPTAKPPDDKVYIPLIIR